MDDRDFREEKSERSGELPRQTEALAGPLSLSPLICHVLSCSGQLAACFSPPKPSFVSHSLSHRLFVSYFSFLLASSSSSSAVVPQSAVTG